MEDILLLDAVERYLGGEMEAGEKALLKNFGKNHPKLTRW